MFFSWYHPKLYFSHLTKTECLAMQKFGIWRKTEAVDESLFHLSNLYFTYYQKKSFSVCWIIKNHAQGIKVPIQEKWSIHDAWDFRFILKEPLQVASKETNNTSKKALIIGFLELGSLRLWHYQCELRQSLAYHT